MRHVVLITFMLYSAISYAQTIEKLDEKNGFKDFKLGDHVSKYNGRLIDKKTSVAYPSIATYHWSGDTQYLFEYPITEIDLIFMYDSLCVIRLYIRSDDAIVASTDFIDLYKYFNRLFGDGESNPEAIAVTWRGNSTHLKLESEYV